MVPTLQPDDLLLVWWAARVRPGDLVVFGHPHHPGLLTVKRATATDPGDGTRWWVERDNPHAGSDSWLFGSIAEADILARVITRLPTRRHRE